MKVKELEKTVNLAWAPKFQYPILLAAGTAAQQVDASFSTSAVLEIYTINLGDPSLDLELRSSIPSDYRFHKLIWGSLHYGDDGQAGLIVGGCDAGRILVYNSSKLLNNDNEIIANLDGHSGPVKSLDFNPFQKNLLASGASESEIYIWDMNNLRTPMTPGKPIQPPDDIVSLAWNKQVQHILTTAFSTRCLVWDLRKNEPIIKLTDAVGKSRWKVVTWDPQVATQLCLASEEDHNPVIQLWDLRYATTPVKVFQGHQKGVLSVAWCDADPDLLVSCGKDDKLLVWNPNTNEQSGEIVCDMNIGTQWNFEVSWCPRNPFLVSTASFDGRAAIYSLSGGKPVTPTSNKIADSFPGMKEYPQSMPQQLQQQQAPVIELLKPPRWMKKPFGVSFGFGGKLVSFGPNEKDVYISQVVTEIDLMLKFKELEDILEKGNIFAHCYDKMEQSNDALVKEVWNFIACQCYGESFKNQAISLLGISLPQLNEKLKSLNIDISSPNDVEGVNSDAFSHISRIGPAESGDIFEHLASHQVNSLSGSVTDCASDVDMSKHSLKFPEGSDIEGVLCDTMLLGDIETAVKLCIYQNRWSDALVLSLSGGPELVANIRDQYLKRGDNNYLCTLVSAIVNEDFCNVVETCDINNWKQVLIVLLTYTRDDKFRSLCESLGQRLLTEGDSSLKRNALICFICAGNVNQLIENWNLNNQVQNDIRELVELGLITRGAFNCRGLNIPVCGALARVLIQYAKLLASQGYLTAAYTTLEESDEEQIVELKDRLMYALGLKSAYSRPEVAAPRSNSYMQPQKSVPPANMYQPPTFGSTYNNPIVATPLITKPPLINQVPPLVSPEKPAAFFPLPLTSQKPPTAPSHQRASQTVQPLVKEPPAPVYPSATHLFPASSDTPPSAATVTGSTSSAFAFNIMVTQPSGMRQPNPSSFPVFANKTANMGMGLPPIAPPTVMQRSTPTPPAPPPPSSQVPYNSNAKQTPDNVTAPTRSKYVVDPSVQGRGAYLSNGFTPGGFQNNDPMMNQLFQPTQQAFAPQQQPNSIAYPVSNESAIYSTTTPNSAPYSASCPDAMSFMQPASQRVSDLPKVASILPVTPGWNDPPSVVYEKIARSQTQTNVATSFHHPSLSFPNDGQQSMAPAANRTEPVTNFPAMANTFQNNFHPPTSRASFISEESMRPKPPLPEEHAHLQTVLETLRSECYNKTNNLQMKHKLDDVAKKLEMLYDTIRENKLSGQTLDSLHNIVNAIQHQNYQYCLTLQTQLVSGPEFSTIAGFMPGIKVLVQSALQLEVYV